MHFLGLLVTVFTVLSTASASWSWAPYADVNSCAERCDTSPDPAYNCQCNDNCETFGDCCDDYYHTCLGAANACKTRCGNDYNSADICHCNSLCKDYNNCCPDYDAYCIGGGSCLNRCGDPLDPAEPCQCNSACLTYGDCCADYDQCNGDADPITKAELSALADELWRSDSSKADPSDYVVNKQTQVSDGNTADRSPLPLFTSVNEAAVFNRPTFAAFISLLDNYNPQYGQNEVVTPGETAELQNFLDVVMATKVMTKAANFAISKGLVASAAEWRAKVDNVWFTLYDRSSPTDSSGFEHVFLGEYKSGSKINGFHNWVQFYLLEKAGEINYYGYVRDDERTGLIGANFNWNGYNKALGGFMFGASPEFELAMMSTCFIAFPGKLCRFDLNGNTDFGIQTYTIFTDYVGSSYFRV